MHSESKEARADVHLRPHPFVRFAMIVPAAVLTYASLNVLIRHPGPETFVLALLFVVPSVAGALRWILVAGASRVEHTLIVRGLIWSRRIPLNAIQRVSKGYSTVYWETSSGQRRATPLTAFWSKPRPAEFITEYNNQRINSIRAWFREEQCSD